MLVLVVVLECVRMWVSQLCWSIQRFSCVRGLRGVSTYARVRHPILCSPPPKPGRPSQTLDTLSNACKCLMRSAAPMVIAHKARNLCRATGRRRHLLLSLAKPRGSKPSAKGAVLPASSSMSAMFMLWCDEVRCGGAGVCGWVCGASGLPEYLAGPRRSWPAGRAGRGPARSILGACYSRTHTPANHRNHTTNHHRRLTAWRGRGRAWAQGPRRQRQEPGRRGKRTHAWWWSLRGRVLL